MRGEKVHFIIGVHIFETCSLLFAYLIDFHVHLLQYKSTVAKLITLQLPLHRVKNCIFPCISHIKRSFK
jgi:hypothetical protein